MKRSRSGKVLGLTAALCALLGTQPDGAAAGPFPTLDKIKAGPGRFKAVLGGNAYLDKETGLVWEKSPSATAKNWGDANYDCYLRKVGGRMGWRLPAVEELYSVFEVNGSGTPQLPLGHPFQNLTADYIWTNTRVASPGNEFIYVVSPSDGDVAFDSPFSSVFTTQAWCVRAGIGHNPQGFSATLP